MVDDTISPFQTMSIVVGAIENQHYETRTQRDKKYWEEIMKTHHEPSWIIMIHIMMSSTDICPHWHPMPDWFHHLTWVYGSPMLEDDGNKTDQNDQKMAQNPPLQCSTGNQSTASTKHLQHLEHLPFHLSYLALDSSLVGTCGNPRFLWWGEGILASTVGCQGPCDCFAEGTLWLELVSTSVLRQTFLSAVTGTGCTTALALTRRFAHKGVWLLGALRPLEAGEHYDAHFSQAVRVARLIVGLARLYLWCSVFFASTPRMQWLASQQGSWPKVKQLERLHSGQTNIGWLHVSARNLTRVWTKDGIHFQNTVALAA